MTPDEARQRRGDVASASKFALARGGRLAVALWLAAIACLIVFAADAALHGGHHEGGPEPVTQAVYVMFFVAAATLCGLRGFRMPGARAPWLAFALALGLQGAGWAYHFLVTQNLEAPPYPSLGDALWLSYYGAVFVGLLLLLRMRLVSDRSSLWADSVIAAAGLGAVGAAILVDPLIASTGGDAAAVATNLAYPLSDFLVLTLIVSAFALTGWRPGPLWGLMGVAFGIQIVADVVYMMGAASGTYETGTLLDASWMVVALLIVYAAWKRGEDPKPGLRLDGWRMFAPPVLFTLIALGVLVYGTFVDLPIAATVLAVVALVGSIVRMTSESIHQRHLSELARRDPLTGLLNHREFHLAVETEIQGEPQNPISVILFDLDGFKQVNDRRGHAEGDRVLRTVAEIVKRACRAEDVPGRTGGDEFALLMPDTAGAGAEAVGERVKREVDALREGVGVSYGIAEWPADGPTKEMFMLRADVALYAQKSGGDGEGLLSAEPALSPKGVEAERAATDRELERAQLRAYATDVRESYGRELRRVKELKQGYLDTVLALAATVSAKDDYTGGHMHRVRDLGLMLGRVVDPEGADDPQMSYGFLLHDIGKLTVPDAILTKPGSLDEDEWTVMRMHPESGVKILANVPFLERALEVVLHHHERWDGEGYPHGLRREQIPLWARIFAVVDTLDAMTTDRPYRKGLPLQIAFEELEDKSGSQFDPACVEALRCLDLIAVERIIRFAPGGDLAEAMNVGAAG